MTGKTITKGITKDIVIVVIGVLIIWLGLRVVFGTENPFYVVSSGSMVPELQVYDVLVVQGNESFENVQNEKAFCISRLEEIKEITVFPSSANFLLLKLSGVFKKDELIRYLHNRLIIVRDCASFRGLENGYIRIAVKNRRDNLLLLEALSDFKKL